MDAQFLCFPYLEQIGENEISTTDADAKLMRNYNNNIDVSYDVFFHASSGRFCYTISFDYPVIFLCCYYNASLEPSP